MATSRRRWPWLVVAALLLAAGAWLMTSAEPERPPLLADVQIPRRMTAWEERRNDGRALWVPAQVVSDAGVREPPPRPRDPVLAALPPTVERVAMVFEANALRNSELGDLMAQCLFAGEELAVLRDAGLDPLTQVDRVTIVDDDLLVSGDFRGARLKELLHADRSQAYGRQGELMDVPGPDGGVAWHAASWGGQLLAMGDDVESLKRTLDRLDGVGPRAPSVLTESQAYGEVYGVLKGGPLAEVIARQDERLAQALREAAQSVELHVDVSHDVGLAAQVDGSDPAKTEELRKALGAALALARAREAAQGHADQARVLDLAHVAPQADQGFRFEAGLPHDLLEKSLRKCVEDRRARRAAQVPPPDGQARPAP